MTNPALHDAIAADASRTPDAADEPRPWWRLERWWGFATGVAIGPTGVRLVAVLLGPIAAFVLWHLQPATSVGLIAAAAALCGGAAMVAVCDVPRAGGLRVAHRWYSLGVGEALFALVVGGVA